MSDRGGRLPAHQRGEPVADRLGMPRRAVVAGGVAVAGDGGDDGPASHNYTQQQADAATKAALEATGGGTANSVERDSDVVLGECFVRLAR